MAASFWTYFTDPVLRGPTIGAMLMCFAASQVGVIAFLRKQSLVGEALSHSAFPGVIIGVLAAPLVGVNIFKDLGVALMIMGGAFLTALISYFVIQILIKKFKISPDSALCFTLSSFFGIGLTLASQVQFTHTVLYRQSLSYIYGQAATMTDTHIFLYGALSLLILVPIILFYKELQAMTFDIDYAKSLGIRTGAINALITVLFVLAVVVGMRSVGVVLMSAMFIAPAAAARQFTHRLSLMLLIAGAIGLFSGFCGNYLSVETSVFLSSIYPQSRLALPTGPMIVIIASTVCLLSLLFAPERGLILRYVRVALFHYRTGCENLLKTIWRYDPNACVTLEQIKRYQSASTFYIKLLLWNLISNRWIRKDADNSYCLTHEGKMRAAHIVRLHRLWEVYLVKYLDVGAEKVHRNAEEMEHIITPELEKELNELLQYPTLDPHKQPIPPPTTEQS